MALASSDAQQSLSGHRRHQVWDASALHHALALLREALVNELLLALSSAAEGEEVSFDYSSLKLTLRSKTSSILREQLSKLVLLITAKLVLACGQV